MFPLTRPYRQALATIAIFATGVLPTILIASTAWRFRGSGHLRDVEIELGGELGFLVSLQSVRYPRPREVVYEGLVLRQEEPRRKGLREIARARALRVQRDDRELLIEADALTLLGESPRLVMAQVGALLQRPLDETYERISLTAQRCDLELGLPGLNYELRELAGTFQTDRVAPSLRFSYRLNTRGSTLSRCEVLFTRDRTIEPIQTSLVMKTVEGPPLPARILDVFFDSSEWLGTGARVDGSLILHQAGATDWDGEFQGNLLDVDLATLVGQRFPSQRLSGLARLAIKSARWGERPGQGRGWINASGALTTGQGSIGLGLLHALESCMSVRVSDRAKLLASRTTDIDFRALGLTFVMSADGEIRLSGALGQEFSPDVIAATSNMPLAYAPRGAVNVRGLIKTLVPTPKTQPDLMIPLTAESQLLLSLPAPPRLELKSIEGN